MKRTSEYFGLKYLVQCRARDRHHFETIAAFDVDDIARKYAKDCAKNAIPGFTYRTMERDGRGQFKPI